MCREFQYRGIGGNRNNFRSKSECLRKCTVPETEDVCSGVIPSPGVNSCRRKKRWIYLGGACTEKPWFGCGETKYMFLTKKKCEAKCVPAPRNALRAKIQRLRNRGIYLWR